MSAESRLRTRALGAVAMLVLVIAGCGDGSSDAGSGSASTLKLEADASGKLRFNASSLEATAGKVTIVLSNPAPLSHNVAIEGAGVDEQGETVGQGGTSRISATLKPGSYTYYCSVPGHRQAGMEGTLT